MCTEVKKSIPEGITNAFFALLGVFITGLVSYLSAMQAASVTSYQSCVARVDAKEAEIRKKSEQFMVAQASLLNLSMHAQPDIGKTETASDELIKAGYALTTFVDDEMADATQLLSLQMTEQLDMSASRNKDPKMTKNLSADIKTSLHDWRESFRKQLKRLDQERSSCHS